MLFHTFRSWFNTSRSLIALTALGLCWSAGSANAQVPGTSDPSWQVATYGPQGYQSANDLATQADGKILSAGHEHASSSEGSPSYLVVRRYGHDGRLDPVFGVNGTVRVLESGRGQHVSVDATGRVYVAGSQNSARTVGGRNLREAFLVVARLLANGALDPSFGSGGIVRIPWTATYNDGGAEADETWLEQRFLSVAAFTGMELQPDGKVLLLTVAKEKTGPETASTLVVARLLENGQLDTAFGTNGLLLPQFDAYDGADVQPMNDNSLLLAVANRRANTGDTYFLKYTAQGAPDAGFGNGGRRLLTDVTAADLALQADGMIVVSGIRSGSNGVVFRIDGNGTLDTAFGNNGYAVLGGRAARLVVRPDGLIIVQTDDPISGGDSLTQLTAAGVTDTSFARPTIDAHYFLGDLVVNPRGIFALPTKYDDGVGWSTTSVRKFLTNAWPRTGSLSNGQTQSFSGFQVDASNMSGTPIDAATTSQVIGLNGYIFPQSTDANAIVDVYVVVATARGLYMRNTSGAFVPWNNQVSTLVPAYEDLSLTGTVHVPVFSGRLPFTGPYYVYLGYMRSNGGPLIYIDEPGALVVSQ